MNVGDVEKQLGTLKTLVTIDQSVDGTINIKPREYIRNKEKWITINKLVLQMGGRWISMSNNSLWQVPLANPRLDVHQRMQGALEALRKAGEFYEEAKRLLTEEP